MVTVRFLRTKRYPHPDGIKRRPGDALPIPAELAELWARNGLVEIASDAATVAPNAEPPEAKPKAEKKGR